MKAKDSGTVIHRADGRWEARATIDGKRRSFYAKTQKEALKAMRAAQTADDNGTYFEPKNVTMEKWLDTWLTEYVALSVKPLTVDTYRSRINAWIKPALGTIKLPELNATQIQTFYNRLTRVEHLAPKTVLNIHGILHKALEQAVRLRYIGFNPADACELPRKTQKEIEPLTEEEIGLFLKELESGEEFDNLFRVALFTGLREGEICGLSWDAVDFKNGTITVKQQLQHGKTAGSEYFISTTKNDKARTITAAPYVMKVLREEQLRQREARFTAGLAWTNEWNLVFTRADGSVIPPPTLLKHFKKIAARIGKPDARFHDLRHTFAVTSLQEGDDIKTVQENLGHATASFTLDVYGHVSERMKEESAARMERFIEKMKA